MTMPLLRPPCEEAAAAVAPETPGCAAHAKRWVLGASVLASSVVFLEATVINVALPAIQSALDAPVATMQWIANTYTLALASLTLVGAALGDQHGRRRLLIVGLALFSVATMLTALAASSGTLIAGRGLQGLGAALVAPNSLALLSGAFPRAERGRALGIWSAAAALTGGVAPLVGGWLVDAASWRAVFLFGVPPALIALAVVAARVPESRAPGGGAPLDLPGAALAALAFASLTAGLIAIARNGDSSAAFLLLAGVALLGAFLWVETRVASPMMPLALFRSPAFSTANLLTLLVYFALSAAFFLLPFALVQGYGYSAARTGAVFLPFAAAMSVLSSWTGGLIERRGARLPLVLGPALTAGGLALLAMPLGDGAYWTTFAPPMTLIGVGMALTAPAVTTLVMSAVDVQQAGIASGVNNTVARLAALLAVAVAGAVALAVFGSATHRRIAALEVAPALRQAVIDQRRDLGDARVPAAAGDAAPALAQALRAALVDAFHAVALLAAACALA
ncbi:MAG TPA: MFS transporter, partial [Candidatus Dormibacteraeota bacterium]|nr:MFS transporter [Candidatus Dormibacteraeota bacterium]